MAAATIARVFAAVSSLYECAVVAEHFDGENPMRWQIRVKLSLSLPRPLV
jgi:hypothetical protein